jgi:hypothetical protein
VKGIMIGCVVLAFIVAVLYVLLAAGIISVPTLGSKDWQRTLIYVAAGCYVLGGLLILVKKRWLWIVTAGGTHCWSTTCCCGQYRRSVS